MSDIILIFNSKDGDDDGSDNEHEAFPGDIPAEFFGAPDFISPGKKNCWTPVCQTSI